MSLQLSVPQALTAAHVLDGFDCAAGSLNDWLKRRALANQSSGASRTFVVADLNDVVYGYYALAAGAISHQIATGTVRRNMPDPIPAMVLGRLAVDRRAQGIKLGAALLQDAVSRVVNISHSVGVRVLLVHAIDDNARRFYLHYGFQQSPLDAMTLMLRLKQATE